jgi:hypothetical protein
LGDQRRDFYRKRDRFLYAAGATRAQTIARVIERFDEIVAAEKPECVQTQS